MRLENSCPAGLEVLQDNGLCYLCDYSKEALCDYPYIGAERIPVEKLMLERLWNEHGGPVELSKNPADGSRSIVFAPSSEDKS